MLYDLVRRRVLVVTASAGGFFVAAAVQAQAVIDETGSIFAIEGEHPEYGRYHGELEIRPQASESGPDGQGVGVVRIATYDDLRFEGLQVQEVWTGIGNLNGAALTVDFALKRADVLQQVDAYQRTPEEFRSPAHVAYAHDLSSEDWIAISLPGHELRERVASAVRRPAGTSALWSSQRTYLPTFGNSSSVIGELAMNTIFWPLVRAYREDPFVAQYRDRAEFQSKLQYFVIDPTDFDFLREHPTTIRVVNKLTDAIAMTEASLRRDAYAPTLADKAQSFDRELRRDHLNPLGLYEIALVNQQGERTGNTPNGDAGLWTGMYAGSQAMRWLATQDPEALASFQRALRGMMLLMDVTGDRAQFARTIRPKAAEADPPPAGWLNGAPPFQSIAYLPGGNNDMLKGILHAFAWAFVVLPPGDPLLGEVAQHAIRLMDLSVVDAVKHPGNWHSAAGLKALATGKRSDMRKYLWFGRTVMDGLSAAQVNSGFYYGGVADWSGINLGTVARVTDIVIASRMIAAFGDDNGLLANARKRRHDLVELWKIYAGARQDELTIAAFAFGVKAQTLAYPPGTIAEIAPTEPQWATDLANSVWSLREMPVSRAFHTLMFDLSLRPDWCASAWPHLPWKVLSGETDMRYYYQGAYNFPLFEGRGLYSDNVWTNAFDYAGGRPAVARHGRIDYLFPYWAARLAGLGWSGD